MAYGYPKPRFDLGRTVATRGASPLCDHLVLLLRRHHCGDWGDLETEDKAANEHALMANLRIVSKYSVQDEEGTSHLIYIITEWNRSMTTIMLASEY